MGGRHQNFEDPMTRSLDISKTKFHLVRFFFTHPLVTCYSLLGTLLVTLLVTLLFNVLFILLAASYLLQALYIGRYYPSLAHCHKLNYFIAYERKLKCSSYKHLSFDVSVYSYIIILHVLFMILFHNISCMFN